MTTTKQEWIEQVQRILLDDGNTGDTACHLAHVLADLHYGDRTPEDSVSAMKRQSFFYTLLPKTPKV